MRANVIDLHTHVLAGLDDGPQSLAESIGIARAAALDGVEALAATPHVRGDYPTSPEAMERGLAQLRAELVAEQVRVDVLPGGEIALDHLPRLSSEELRRFGLGGNPDYVLLEFPYFGWPLSLPEELFRLRANGLTPVLAHPERNPEVQQSPARLGPLVELGALVQLTAASLDGRSGSRARTCASALLDLTFAHLVASDAHAPGIRAAGLSAAARSLKNDDLARWLTEDVPSAIVAGESLPPRPRIRKRFRIAVRRG